MNSLPTAELAIYVVLSIPVLYILVQHWSTGILGWFYLFSFCTLRIIGGAMSMKSYGGPASIVSNVGLSPLLLAACGILHQARAYRATNLLKNPFEWVVVAMFHIQIASGIGLVAAGASALEGDNSGTASTSSHLRLMQAGMGILTASWAFLCVWAATSALPFQKEERNAVLFREGTVLLLSVIVSLIFIGIRVIYSLVAFSTQKAYLSPVTGSLAVRVLLSFLPEFIAALVFIFAGIKTRRLNQAQPGAVKD